ncbi:MAG: hypothetical protein LIO90_04400 [Bacteroidales bacterium]|nr:hypothetical protein [Bacteroidales bacterium]
MKADDPTRNDNSPDDGTDGGGERRRLYQAFREELMSHGAPGFYEEGDLIDIFDYAADINDDYVRMEVLLCAARIHPHSAALAERKAYYYYELGNDEAALAAIKQAPEASVLRRLLELRLDDDLEVDTEETLSSLLAQTVSFEDEELIRLVDMARELNCYSWLKDNFEKIKAHTDFPQAFIYELVSVAEGEGDYDFALQLIEELTMLEPFNTEFWVMLATGFSQYPQHEDLEKALQAIDYALAIDPKMADALMLLSDIRHVKWCNDNAELPPSAISEVELTPILTPMRDAMRSHPQNQQVMLRLSRLLIVHGRQDEVDEVMSRFADANPDVQIGPMLDVWCMWAQQSVMLDPTYRVTADMLLAFERNFVMPRNDLYYETLYRTGHYTEVVEGYEKSYGSKHDGAPMTHTFVYMLALLRLKLYKNIDLLVGYLIEKSGEVTADFATLLQGSTMGAVAQMVKNAMDKNGLNRLNGLMLDAIDPLTTP